MSIVSEAEIEYGFVGKLTDLKYTSRPDITDRKSLEENFRQNFEALNGDCELKEINFVPQWTYLVKPPRIMEVLRRIKNENGAAPYSNRREIVRLLKKAVDTGANKSKQNKHIENITDMLVKDRIFD